MRQPFDVGGHPHTVVLDGNGVVTIQSSPLPPEGLIREVGEEATKSNKDFDDRDVPARAG